MTIRFFLLSLFALSFLMSGCNGEALRYEPSHLYTKFSYGAEDSWAHYREDVREKLKINWQALLDDRDGRRPADVETIVDLLAPTDRPPMNCPPGQGRNSRGRYKRGILLIHGLYDSPYMMKDLERFFNGNCFYSRSLLLPGHGTRPGDMLEVSYKEWIKAVDFALASFSDEVEELYVAGFSTGGTLAVRKALKEPASMKGLFLFAPALKVKSAFAGLLQALGKRWVPWQKFDDDDFARYESIALNSVVEVDRLTEEVREELDGPGDGLTIPAMIVLSDGDYTIHGEETMRLFNEGRFGKEGRMVVYHRGERPDSVPPSCYNRDDASVSECRKVYYNSSFSYEMDGAVYRISDFSHMSLTLAPDDEHYGLDGDYRYCLQYFLVGQEGSRKLCEEAGPEKVCLGERSAFGSQSYGDCEEEGRVVRRLTSNPLFEVMTRQIGAYIESLAQLKHREQGR